MRRLRGTATGHSGLQADAERRLRQRLVVALGVHAAGQELLTIEGNLTPIHWIGVVAIIETNLRAFD
jgi:hypothetical protein